MELEWRLVGPFELRAAMPAPTVFDLRVDPRFANINRLQRAIA